MMQNVVSQPTQAQTDEVVTMNAFSPPVHSQVSPFIIDDEPMASSKVEDFQITSLLMPHGKFFAEGVAVDVPAEVADSRSLSSIFDANDAEILKSSLNASALQDLIEPAHFDIEDDAAPLGEPHSAQIRNPQSQGPAKSSSTDTEPDEAIQRVSSI